MRNPKIIRITSIARLSALVLATSVSSLMALNTAFGHESDEVAVCSLQDSNFGNTHYAAASNKIDAEIAARSKCSRKTYPYFCDRLHSEVKCDDNVGLSSLTFSCSLMQDGQAVYEQVGRTIVEAEAKSRILCEGKMSPSRCNRLTAHCEPLD